VGLFAKALQGPNFALILHFGGLEAHPVSAAKKTGGPLFLCGVRHSAFEVSFAVGSVGKQPLSQTVSPKSAGADKYRMELPFPLIVTDFRGSFEGWAVNHYETGGIRGCRDS